MMNKRIVYSIAIVILGFVACTFLLGLKGKETRPQPIDSRRVHEALSPPIAQRTGPDMLKSLRPTTSAIVTQKPARPTTGTTAQESLNRTTSDSRIKSLSPTTSTAQESTTSTTGTIMMDKGVNVSAVANSIYPKVGLIGTDPKSYCCNDSSAGVSLEVLCGKTSGRGDTEECTCVDYMYCRLVVMTGISSNHFEESRDMIASVQKFLPNTKLIVYDLGLNDVERKNVSTYCNIELRTFHFELYPPHVKELFKYAWKPIIYRDVAEEYEVILYMDSSIRLKGNFKNTVLPLLQTFPFVAGPLHSVPIISMIHEGMLDYLKVSRQEVADVFIRTIQGGVHTVWVTQQIKEKFIKYWVDCALHPECIAPPGAGISPCDWNMITTNPGEYVGCHRFDQSALNVILYREFGAEVWRNLLQHDQLVRAVFNIEKHPTSFYEGKYCTS